ncbi:MAG: hypothetical protein HC880_20580 [Bacteroidia bacterium]|nr:hypothetical protein [Bacteroidia bacterium]
MIIDSFDGDPPPSLASLPAGGRARPSLHTHRAKRLNLGYRQQPGVEQFIIGSSPKNLSAQPAGAGGHVK